MRGNLIAVIERRLADLKREAGPEQSREIRELQQLVVGLEQRNDDGEE